MVARIVSWESLQMPKVGSDPAWFVIMWTRFISDTIILGDFGTPSIFRKKGRRLELSPHRHSAVQKLCTNFSLIIVRGDRKSQVRQCFVFCLADS